MPRAATVLALLLSSPAWAGPDFVSLDPGLVRTATVAWEAAVECTGWEAQAHPEVLIERTYVDGGFGGLAHIDEQGLRRIEIGVGVRHVEEVLVHEVSHAWVNGGPAALTEGRTDLLADCIVQRRPGLAPLQWDDGRRLDALPDLLAWTNPMAAHRPGNPSGAHTASYLGADRLLRTAVRYVEPSWLWPRDGRLEWEELGGMLAVESEQARLLAEVLQGGAEVQQEALSDDDHDGLPQLAEVFDGTRADRWDSDGDGWWDGAPLAPSGAVPLPMDGTPVCSGWATGAEGGTVDLFTGGNLRGRHLPEPELRAGTIPVLRGRQGRGSILARSSVLLTLGGDPSASSGGLWAAVGGDVEPDPGCTSDARTTVWAEDRGLVESVPAYDRALAAVLDRAEVQLGPLPRRVVVVLGDPPGWRDGLVYHGAAQVGLALAEDELEALAAHAVASSVLHDAGIEDWDAVEALAGELMGEEGRGMAAMWSYRARQCPSGWSGLVNGRCDHL